VVRAEQCDTARLQRNERDCYHEDLVDPDDNNDSHWTDAEMKRLRDSQREFVRDCEAHSRPEQELREVQTEQPKHGELGPV
jgi:hypothetical protein